MAPSTYGRPVRDGAIRPVAAPAASDARAPKRHDRIDLCGAAGGNVTG